MVDVLVSKVSRFSIGRARDEICSRKVFMVATGTQGFGQDARNNRLEGGSTQRGRRSVTKIVSFKKSRHSLDATTT
jgi:hypothetical protein